MRKFLLFQIIVFALISCNEDDDVYTVYKSEISKNSDTIIYSKGGDDEPSDSITTSPPNSGTEGDPPPKDKEVGGYRPPSNGTSTID